MTNDEFLVALFRAGDHDELLDLIRDKEQEDFMRGHAEGAGVVQVNTEERFAEINNVYDIVEAWQAANWDAALEVLQLIRGRSYEAGYQAGIDAQRAGEVYDD